MQADQHAEEAPITVQSKDNPAPVDAEELYRTDSADTFYSSPSFTSTRRSSDVATSLNDGSTHLSSRTSLSSLQPAQSPVQKAVATDLEDIHLQQICANEIKASRFSSRPDPFADFTCAFGFTGKLDDLSAVPNTKKAFLEAVKTEQRAAGFIQQGLASYITAINSGEHHTFDQDFLEHQNNASDATTKQLQAINEHLIEVIEEVNEVHQPDHDDAEVREDLKIAYGHARPWIQRTRAILVSAHVFYKINYVLASDKKGGNDSTEELLA